MSHRDPLDTPLGLRVGELVQVRSEREILATLDRNGRLDALPFMPEMLASCGQVFRVLKRIDKVNDTVDRSGLRRMHHAVILEGNRCDGQFHGGCQALCQFIWKEPWLRRVDGKRPGRSHHVTLAPTESHETESRPGQPACTSNTLFRLARRTDANSNDGHPFCCQATEIKNASSPLAWWDPRQYWRDLRSGNVRIGEMIRVFFFWIFTLMLRVSCYRLLLWTYNRVQRIRGGQAFPYRWGVLEKTPKQLLNLKPGEIVRVKSHDAIVATLDTRNKNRGLWFDVEMVKYCGGTYKVRCRVERIIDHKTGRLITLPNDCIILDGVTTRGDYHRFYPQNEYPFWREIWLERVPNAPGATSRSQEGAHAQKGA